MVLDEGGWVDIDLFLEGLRKHSKNFENVTIHDLEKVIEGSDKRRFEIKNGKIRATYGHSLPSKIKKQLTVPPEILYHGTTPKAAESILMTGLKPCGRQYVHLSVDIKSAYKVGRRRTKEPVILEVMAQDAYNAGINFYKEDGGIWLSDAIPAKFIKA